MSDILISQQMPILALRGLTVFPEMVVHFDIGREKSILAMEAAMNEEQTIFLVTQKDVFVDDPKQKDLYEVGTVAHIKQVLRLPHDSIRILVNGLYRAKISSMEQDGPYLKGRVETLNIPSYRKQTPKIVALLRQSAHYFEQMMELSQKPQQEILLRLVSTTDPGIVADALGQYATFGYEEKMQILKQLHPVKRLELANRLLAKELEVLGIESELNERAQESINKGQKDYYLREQLKVIRSELGEEDEDNELDEYRQKIKALELSEDTEKKLLKEVSRLGKQPQGSSEAAVIRELSGYLPGPAMEHPDEGTGQCRSSPEAAGCRSLWPGKGQGADFRILGSAAAVAGCADGDPLPGGPPRRWQDIHRLQHRPVPEPEAGAHRPGRCPR